MDDDIARYVTSCDACQRNKPSTQAPMGPMQPLPDSDSALAASVSMDLITQLPRSRCGHDAIVVFVDKLTKMVHYVATTTTVTAPQLASLFMREVVRLHGVPESILSDRDPRFTAHFWRAFWAQLGTTLTMSTAYHPQTDGQTERANRTLEEMLRSRVNFAQTDWDEHLAAAELAINNATQASTGFTPFYLNYGQEVQLPLDHGLAAAAPDCNNPAAAERIRRLHVRPRPRAHAHRSSTAATERTTPISTAATCTFQSATRCCCPPSICASLGADTRTPKFTYKYIGPFKIKRVSQRQRVRARPAAALQIHPVLNITRLKPYRDGAQLFPSRPPPDSRPPPEIADRGW